MIGRLLAFAGRIGADPAETEDERVRRLIWCVTNICAVPVSLGMAAALATLGLRLAAALWALSAAFWTAELLLFGALRRGLNAFGWPASRPAWCLRLPDRWLSGGLCTPGA